MRIFLVRHGRPEKAGNEVCNSAGFANWVKNYNHSVVSNDSRPSYSIPTVFQGCYVVSSNLPRAIDSCKIFLGKAPDMQSSLYREMDIPRFKLPFALRAWTWVYLNRALWMLGKRGSFESYSDARLRAKIAAKELVNLAKKHEDIIVFAHGYLNLHMRKHLRQSGFKQITKSNSYWGVSAFET